MNEPTSALIASALKQDPRIEQARQLVLNTIRDYQRKCMQVKPAQEGLKQTYKQQLNLFNEYRGAPLYFPYLGSGFGNGALVELADGSIKYDMISGIGVHYLGHHHLDLVSSNFSALLCDTIMQGHLQQTVDTLELSEILLKASGMDHCFLSSSGAMANENGLKIALQKKHPAYRILAFDQCFMGRTLTLSQLTDKPHSREGLPSTIHVDYIPFYQPHAPEKSIQEAVATLKKHLKRYPKQHAAMCFELIQGEGGFYPGTTEFFKALMDLLKDEGIIIFVDEIQTFGRTSSLFAYQYFHLEDYVDIVTIGKLTQVCATLFKKEFKTLPGLLSQTFTSSTSAIYAAKTILHSLMNEGYLGPEGKIMSVYHHFLHNFKEIEKRHPQYIQGPYGIGSMIAFTPLTGELKQVTRFVQALFEAGVISFIAGSSPTRVRFLIPVGSITPQDIDGVTKLVEEVLLTSN